MTPTLLPVEVMDEKQRPAQRAAADDSGVVAVNGGAGASPETSAMGTKCKRVVGCIRSNSSCKRKNVVCDITQQERERESARLCAFPLV